MYCGVSANPEAQISWKLEKTLEMKKNISLNQTENSFIIHNISFEETGIYYCTAKNTLGTAEGAITIKIKGMKFSFDK